VLAIYLLVLAPLNWGVFRLLGRVEWAWLAAPAIAVIGALAVVRLAQLDIGFARSTTELAVVEMYEGYPRAHVTRFAALYTSLSTGYDFLFEEEPCVAQPFAARTRRRDATETLHEVMLRQEANLQLDGFQVASNSIGYMHSEQVCDLGGPIQLLGDDESGWSVANGTDYLLRDVGLMRRRDDGRVETAWLDELKPKASRNVDFRHAPDGAAYVPEWNRSLTTLGYDAQRRMLLDQLDSDGDGSLSREEASADPQIAEAFDRLDLESDSERGIWGDEELTKWSRETRSGEVSVGELIDVAARHYRLARSEVRLVGWSDQELPHMSIQPSSAQATRRTLFVVHLRPGPLPPATRDANCKADIVDEKAPSLNEDDVMLEDEEEMTEAEVDADR
jgi:hypothetical protein